MFFFWPGNIIILYNIEGVIICSASGPVHNNYIIDEVHSFEVLCHHSSVYLALIILIAAAIKTDKFPFIRLYCGFVPESYATE